MFLPLETIGEIIDALARPNHPRQYGHDDVTLDSLRSLCLCNHDIHRLATPWLYRSIRILSDQQFIRLHDLFITNPHLANHVTSLYLGGFNFHTNDQVFLLGNITQLTSFFTALQPSLRRLCVDRDIYTMFGINEVIKHQRNQLMQAIHHCHDLEEFCNIRASYGLWQMRASHLNPNSPWAHGPIGWKRMKRLLLYNVGISLWTTRSLMQEYPSVVRVITPVSHGSWHFGLTLPPKARQGKIRLAPESVDTESNLARWFGYSKSSKVDLALEECSAVENEDDVFQMLEIMAKVGHVPALLPKKVLDGSIWDVGEDFDADAPTPGSAE